MKKGAAKVEKEDAKIDGAKQIAIGIKKEVDFPGWYTNVSSLLLFNTKGRLTDFPLGSLEIRHD